jgi:RNA polymerase sigma factor (TIGR02999 family)
LAQESPGQTLQATALVHEAWLRLVDVKQAQHWDSRGHFFAAAAEAMRRILVDQARRKGAEIHGGDRQRVELAEGDWFSSAAPEDIVDLDDSLSRLAEDDPLAAKIARLRLFAGLSVDEAANCLNVSRATANRHWVYGRAFLRAERTK